MMTKEYISRDEMIKQTKAQIVLGAPKFNTGLKAAIEVATSITAADVVGVRHGWWVIKSDDLPILNDKVYGCSLCDDNNRRYYEWQLSNYCPNCGAKMDGGQDDGMDIGV